MDWDKAKAETLFHYQSIVRINTSNPPGNETAVVNYLKDVLDHEGISYQVFALEPSRANLVARLKGNGRKKPILILGHTDTVGVQPEVWPVDPFGAVRKDGYIWGRGTTDNKDCVAAGLMLMLQLKRLRVPLDRDVIYVAEASEESSSGPISVGIDYLIKEHWPDIEAEYALAEGGFVHSENGRVRFVEIAATEKVPRRAKLIATGTSGHGSRPRRDNAIVHLSTAVSKIGNWEPPMRLNDVTRTFFERLATISPPEEAARYNGLVDPAKDRRHSELFRRARSWQVLRIAHVYLADNAQRRVPRKCDPFAGGSHARYPRAAGRRHDEVLRRDGPDHWRSCGEDCAQRSLGGLQRRQAVWTRKCFERSKPRNADSTPTRSPFPAWLRVRPISRSYAPRVCRPTALARVSTKPSSPSTGGTAMSNASARTRCTGWCNSCGTPSWISPRASRSLAGQSENVSTFATGVSSKHERTCGSQNENGRARDPLRMYGRRCFRASVSQQRNRRLKLLR